MAELLGVLNKDEFDIELFDQPVWTRNATMPMSISNLVDRIISLKGPFNFVYFFVQ